jgi:hypothetical protein
MVSRYRDIIESNQSSLSRTPSFTSTQTNLRNSKPIHTTTTHYHTKHVEIGSAHDGNADSASINGLSSIVTPTTKSHVRSFVDCIIVHLNDDSM